MKRCFVCVTVLVLLSSTPSHACGCCNNIYKVVMRLLVSAAAGTEGTASISAMYLAQEDKRLTDSQKTTYWVEGFSLLTAAVIAPMSIFCCSSESGGMGLASGSLATLAALTGFIATWVEYAEHPPQASHSDDYDKAVNDLQYVAFHAGWIGAGIHFAAAALSALRSCCSKKKGSRMLLEGEV